MDVDFGASSGEILAHLEMRFAAPRNYAVVERYVRERLPPGRYALFGAGVHTERLLPVLREREDIQVLGLIDRLADGAPRLGLPTVPPGRADELGADFILLSHTDREPEMMNDLVAGGPPVARVLPIYGDSDYARFATAAVRSRIDFDLVRSADNLLIYSGTEHRKLILDDALSTVLPGKTVAAYVGREDHFRPSPTWPTVNVCQSLPLLVEVIAAAAPRVVYLRTTFQTSMPELNVLLAERFPSVRLVHELYDWGGFVEDWRLAKVWGFDQDSIRLGRAAEMMSAHRSVFMVHKNSGPFWRDVARQVTAPNGAVFPGITGGEIGPSVAALPPFQIVYSGSLYAENTATQNESLQMLEVMTQVASGCGAHFHLLNAAHGGTDEDHRFQRYLNLDPTHFTYRRRLTYDGMQAELRRCHFGWMYAPRVPGLEPESLWRVAPANKLSDFIHCGLPVIVVDDFEAAAELVRDFQAGIVGAADDPEQVVHALRNADYAVLRAGVARLSAHMQRVNAETLAALAKAVRG